MKRIAIRALLPTVWSFSVALAFCLPLSPVAAQEQNAQIIEVSAKKYEYSPSPVHVKAGSKVQLKITAVDHDHGFKIGAEADGAKPGGKAGLVFSSPQDCWQLKKGETQAKTRVPPTRRKGAPGRGEGRMSPHRWLRQFGICRLVAWQS